MKIRIGARGSKLSLIQTNIIKDKLLKNNPHLEISIQIIKTQGDTNLSPIPLDTVGKGWFTKELDKELLLGNIDIAVHSLKDVPEDLPKGLCIAGIPKREDARDVLVSKNNISLHHLPKGAVIGTDSVRRKVQILHKRPDLIVKSLRGNVDSRLKKLQGNEYDAIIIAAAGVHRLQLDSLITEYFDEDDIVPSPGQGTLAIIVKEDNHSVIPFVKQLNNEEAIAAAHAERSFSKKIEGGCKTPTGAYAMVKQNTITISGMIASENYADIIKDKIKGDIKDAKELGIKLAEKLLDVQYAKQQSSLTNKRIVITRPASENRNFAKRLTEIGLEVYSFPTIKIVKNELQAQQIDILKQIHDFDWIIFTSAKGVEYFMEEMDKIGVDKHVIEKKQVAVVGPKTAEKAASYGLFVTFMPTKYTTSQLAKELSEVSQKKILLARSSIGSKELITELQKREAIVTDIPIYKTEYITEKDDVFEKFVKNNTINYITFTSPSTVTGFFKRVSAEILQKVLEIPVISVGPVTTEAVQKAGFTHIITAHEYTTEGMLQQLVKLL